MYHRMEKIVSYNEFLKNKNNIRKYLDDIFEKIPDIIIYFPNSLSREDRHTIYKNSSGYLFEKLHMVNSKYSIKLWRKDTSIDEFIKEESTSLAKDVENSTHPESPADDTTGDAMETLEETDEESDSDYDDDMDYEISQLKHYSSSLSKEFYETSEYFDDRINELEKKIKYINLKSNMSLIVIMLMSTTILYLDPVRLITEFNTSSIDLSPLTDYYESSGF